MSRFTPRLWRLLLVAFMATALTLSAATPSFAQLSGSTFEGNDGNLVVATSGNTDWANVANPTTGPDKPSGSSDDAFGQGAKEDSIAPSIVSGSIPPNKNDLTRFYVASEFASNANYLYLAWERLVNIGAADIDFEINQNRCGAAPTFTNCSANHVTPTRKAGDLLVLYEFSGSGTPTIEISKWVTSGQCEASSSLPCWGKVMTLNASEAEAAVNTVTVTDPLNGGASLTTGLFGETAINLTTAGVFPAGTCEAFGSAYTKARTSGSSFDSELKDFIAPQPVNISNCGTVTIIKHTDPRGLNQTFSYTSNVPGHLSFTLNDTGNTTSDSITNTIVMTNVPVSRYTVTEGAEPANFTLESLTCTSTGGSSGSQDPTNRAQADIMVVADGTTTCTYTNQQQLGAIKITKTSTKGTALPGATFSIKDSNGNPISGSPFTTGGDGTVCVDHLTFGTYSVQETAAPTGYKIDDPNPESVPVGTNATCGSGNEATKSFTDTPLSTIEVKFSSQSGTTSATITCKDESGSTITPDSSSTTGSDQIYLGLVPNTTSGNYTCTVHIDP